MKNDILDEASFKKLLEAYLKEEYDKADPKPNGLASHMGFYIQKEREFEKKMISEGRLKRK